MSNLASRTLIIVLRRIKVYFERHDYHSVKRHYAFWWVVMVTLHEATSQLIMPTVLQTAVGGTTLVCLNLVDRKGIEPLFSDRKSDFLTIRRTVLRMLIFLCEFVADTFVSFTSTNPATKNNFCFWFAVATNFTATARTIQNKFW